MRVLSDTLPADAVVVDEGLTSSLALPRLWPYRDERSYYGLASGGIGFAVAGAVGIRLAVPDRPVVAVIGDGSALYNIQALWTAAHLRLPMVYVIANNRGYRILKQRVRAGHGVERFVGMDFDDPPVDFAGLAPRWGSVRGGSSSPRTWRRPSRRRSRTRVRRCWTSWWTAGSEVASGDGEGVRLGRDRAYNLHRRFGVHFATLRVSEGAIRNQTGGTT